MVYGEQVGEADAHAQLSYAADCGVNFLDTAEMYPVAPRAETQGRTSEIVVRPATSILFRRTSAHLRPSCGAARTPLRPLTQHTRAGQVAAQPEA